MKSKASVRPSKASAIATVIIGTLFLVFAVVFIGNTAEGEARPYVLMFMVIWIAVCGFTVVYGLTIIFSKRPPAVTEIDMEDRQSDSPVPGLISHRSSGSSNHCEEKGSSTKKNTKRSARKSCRKNGSPPSENHAGSTPFHETGHWTNMSANRYREIEGRP